MASKSGDMTDDDDVEAELRLQKMMLVMKQQADELLLTNQLDKALTLYRELLMHLTHSQVTLLEQRELVISCRMNILASLSKLKRWSTVVTEAGETLSVFADLTEAKQRLEMMEMPSEEQERENQVLARAYYFRGFAYMKMGALLPAQQDFKQSMELNPDDETIQNDYMELQTALQAEQRVKQFLATSMKYFQTGNYQSAVEACKSALRESQQLQKTELTGLIHGNLAAIYVKMKDDGKAIDHYKRTMLLTRCCYTKPTAAQNERVFDILDSLAGCYSRKRDYSSALSVIEDQTKLLPLCPERTDREAMMYLNGGRICYTMGRYPQAEEHLEQGYNVAAKMSSQLDVALNCAFWLSKAHIKNSKTEKAIEVLGTAISAAEKEAEAATITGLLGKLLLARLELLEPETSFPRSFCLEQLRHTFKFFQEKPQTYGCLRAAEVLVHALEVDGDDARSEIMRILAVVDCLNIGNLSTPGATIFMELMLTKVDLMISQRPSARKEGKSLLVQLLRELEHPGGADLFCRQQLRSTVLHKLVGVANYGEEEEHDEDIRELLEKAVDSIRACKVADDSAARAMLEVMLLRIGHWKAARGDMVGAEEVLKENVGLLRGSTDSKNDRLYESLVGLCVVQIRLGMLEEATEVLKEVETSSATLKADELSIIKRRLEAAVAVAHTGKQNKFEDYKQSLVSEKQHPVSNGQNFCCGFGQVWWGRWCGPLLAFVAAVVVALMFA